MSNNSVEHRRDQHVRILQSSPTNKEGLVSMLNKFTAESLNQPKASHSRLAILTGETPTNLIDQTL